VQRPANAGFGAGAQAQHGIDDIGFPKGFGTAEGGGCLVCGRCGSGGERSLLCGGDRHAEGQRQNARAVPKVPAPSGCLCCGGCTVHQKAFLRKKRQKLTFILKNIQAGQAKHLIRLSIAPIKEQDAKIGISAGLSTAEKRTRVLKIFMQIVDFHNKFSHLLRLC
jgi:hypothetical protein